MLSNIDNHAFTRVNVHEAPHDMTNPEGNQQSSSACQALETLGHQNGSGNEESEDLDKQTACKKSGGKEAPKKYSRTYTKWSSEDTKLVNSYFQKCIVDTQTNGSLPPKTERLNFFSMHDILQGHDNKYQLVTTKVFNEKKKLKRYLFQGTVRV